MLWSVVVSCQSGEYTKYFRVYIVSANSAEEAMQHALEEMKEWEIEYPEEGKWEVELPERDCKEIIMDNGVFLAMDDMFDG